MNYIKDRVKDFRPPEDWQSCAWSERFEAFDPDYARILTAWLQRQSPDMIHHYVRNIDATSASMERDVAFWLIDQPNLDRATAHLLFWKLMSQFPYFGTAEELSDEEHDVPRLADALTALTVRLQNDDFEERRLALTPKELEPQVTEFQRAQKHAVESGYDITRVPFSVPTHWSKPIAGTPPEVSPRFPASDDPLVAAFMMTSSIPSRKEMFRLAERYDVMNGSDQLILVSVLVGCGAFVAFVLYRLFT